MHSSHKMGYFEEDVCFPISNNNSAALIKRDV